MITNYNYAEYVREAVDSALGQDHPHVRVVVIDDGSTDGSPQLLAEYGEAIDLVLDDNRGQVSALNAGFARCRGDVVIFLDADDVLAPSTARLAATALAAKSDAARAQFRMALIDAEGRSLGITRPNRPPPSGDLRRAELAFPFDLPWVAMSGNAYRTSALRRIMPIPKPGEEHWFVDVYLVHMTTLLGSVVSRADVGAFYRVHGRNLFEPVEPVLDLERIRWEIRYQQKTAEALARLADELGLERPAQILSMSNIANRVVSRKLAPRLHPVPADSWTSLMASAVRAARRRYDVSLVMRLALVGWMAAILAAPPRLATRLSELLVFPELRPWGTRLLERMHRSEAVVSRPAGG